jgi:hypothetical protein
LEKGPYGYLAGHLLHYTGPAPEEVRCEGCKGVFYVSDLSHRRERKSIEIAAHSDNGRRRSEESTQPELQARLFPAESDHLNFDESDDIPF